jgi:hypothetical protein
MQSHSVKHVAYLISSSIPITASRFYLLVPARTVVEGDHKLPAMSLRTVEAEHKLLATFLRTVEAEHKLPTTVLKDCGRVLI